MNAVSFDGCDFLAYERTLGEGCHRSFVMRAMIAKGTTSLLITLVLTVAVCETFAVTSEGARAAIWLPAFLLVIVARIWRRHVVETRSAENYQRTHQAALDAKERLAEHRIAVAKAEHFLHEVADMRTATLRQLPSLPPDTAEALNAATAKAHREALAAFRTVSAQ